MSDHEDTAADLDRLLGFTLPARHVRGRMVRVGPALERILGSHAYPPAIRDLLAEALVLTALMGGLLKHVGSQLTMQVQSSDAIVELLVCDYIDGALRGYVKHDVGRIDSLGPRPSLRTLFGGGSLAITFDLTQTAERYQGIVPLEGNSLTEAVEQYFARSEQVPTLIRTAVHSSPQGSIGGGFLIQHLPNDEDGADMPNLASADGDWDHAAVLAASVSHEELSGPSLAMEDLLWRLFHEEPEIRLQTGVAVTRGCRCSIEHFEHVLARFSKEDRRDMRDDNGLILVDCAFCSRQFAIED